MTTDEARALVAGAKTIEDVLGPGHDDAGLRLFRRLVHPDRCGGDETAWAKLERLASGTTSDTAAAATAPAAFSPLEIRTRSRTYALTGLLARGDLCDVYESTRDGQPVVVKVAGTASDADLLDAEARTLRDFPADVPVCVGYLGVDPDHSLTTEVARSARGASVRHMSIDEYAERLDTSVAVVSRGPTHEGKTAIGGLL